MAQGKPLNQQLSDSKEMKSSDQLYNELIKTYPVYLTKPEYAAVRTAVEEALETTQDDDYARELASVLENFTWL